MMYCKTARSAHATVEFGNKKTKNRNQKISIRFSTIKWNFSHQITATLQVSISCQCHCISDLMSACMSVSMMSTS